MTHLLGQDVVIELCSDGLTTGNLPNMLVELWVYVLFESNEEGYGYTGDPLGARGG
jgi:hypothetical protein